MEKQTEIIEKFNELSKFINAKGYDKPSESDIKRTISRIKKRLISKRAGLACNEAVRFGYEMALKVLADNNTEVVFNHSPQATAIAMLAKDYINGECSEDTLCQVPMKKK